MGFKPMEQVLSPVWAGAKNTRGKSFASEQTASPNRFWPALVHVSNIDRILIDPKQVTCKHQGSTVDQNLCVPSERPDEQVCWAYTATISMIALLRLLWTSLMPDTGAGRSHASCPSVH